MGTESKQGNTTNLNISLSMENEKRDTLPISILVKDTSTVMLKDHVMMYQPTLHAFCSYIVPFHGEMLPSSV